MILIIREQLCIISCLPFGRISAALQGENIFSLLIYTKPANSVINYFLFLISHFSFSLFVIKYHLLKNRTSFDPRWRAAHEK